MCINITCFHLTHTSLYLFPEYTVSIQTWLIHFSCYLGNPQSKVFHFFQIWGYYHQSCYEEITSHWAFMYSSYQELNCWNRDSTHILNFNRKGQVVLQSGWSILYYQHSVTSNLFFFLPFRWKQANMHCFNLHSTDYCPEGCIFLCMLPSPPVLRFVSSFLVPAFISDCRLFPIDCMTISYMFCILILCYTHCTRKDFKTLHSKHFRGHQVKKLLSGVVSELAQLGCVPVSRSLLSQLQTWCGLCSAAGVSLNLLDLHPGPSPTSLPLCSEPEACPCPRPDSSEPHTSPSSEQHSQCASHAICRILITVWANKTLDRSL